MLARRVALVLLALLAGARPAAAQDKIKVVASFSILADLVTNVGGDRVEVTALVGPNSDAHVYRALAGRLAAGRGRAGSSFVNGLGFEGWLGRLVRRRAPRRRSWSRARASVRARAQAKPGLADDETDPHAWQSVANAKRYVANIRDALIKADPAGEGAYEANAAAYLAKLDALDREVRDVVAGIPADRRRVITSHDAFGYFAGRLWGRLLAPAGRVDRGRALGARRRPHHRPDQERADIRASSWRTSPTRA